MWVLWGKRDNTTGRLAWMQARRGFFEMKTGTVTASQGMTWNNLQYLWEWTFLWTFIRSFIFHMSFMLTYLHFPKTLRISQLGRVHVSSKFVLMLLLFTGIISTAYYQISRNWSQHRLKKTRIWLQHLPYIGEGWCIFLLNKEPKNPRILKITG